jgi:phosphodiesterase/alkaline phosphatase D-like protein
MNRREMLVGAGALAGAAIRADGRPIIAASEPARKLKFVVTGGHPGDPEYGCGGTIARLTAMGHEADPQGTPRLR